MEEATALVRQAVENQTWAVSRFWSQVQQLLAVFSCCSSMVQTRSDSTIPTLPSVSLPSVVIQGLSSKMFPAGFQHLPLRLCFSMPALPPQRSVPISTFASVPVSPLPVFATPEYPMSPGSVYVTPESPIVAISVPESPVPSGGNG